MTDHSTPSLATRRKDAIRRLLKGIETGDPASVEVVNEAKYIQHNPQTHEGSEGLAALFKRLSKTSPRVNVVRIFADGDFVFGHTEYDFSTRRIGFEVFRFEGLQAVEHWDNIQSRMGPNASGRTMVDGVVASRGGEAEPATEATRARVNAYVKEVLIGGALESLSTFVAEDLQEHSPHSVDGLDALEKALHAGALKGAPTEYARLHRVLAEGDFALSVCEGRVDGKHAALYDLFRLEGDRIVEHWDTVEKIAPKSEWKNDNGKF